MLFNDGFISVKVNHWHILGEYVIIILVILKGDSMKNIFKNKIFNKSKSKRRAFTVAETLSVLVLLGVIAAIMIPTMALKYRESVRRTQLKSALATYKQVIGQMVGEHKFTSTAALDEWAAGPFDGDGNATCGNARAYFHIVEEYSVNRQTYPCIFKTPDGMWWYIMGKYIISSR